MQPEKPTELTPDSEHGAKQPARRQRPGRPETHGARRYARLYKAGALDKRTWAAQRHQQHLDEIVAEHGGADKMTHSELVLAARAAFRAVYLELVELHRLRSWNHGSEPMEAGPDYGAQANGLRRDLEALRESARQRNAKGNAPDLESYLATATQEPTPDATGDAESDDLAPDDLADEGDGADAQGAPEDDR